MHKSATLILLIVLTLTDRVIADDKTFLWNPPQSEYSCSFSGTPTITEVESIINGERVVSPMAQYLNGPAFQRANFQPRPFQGPVVKAVAVAEMTEYARNFGMEHFDVAFDDSKPHDVTTTLRASKTIKGNGQDVVMNIYAVCHYGRKNVFTLTIGEAAKIYPTENGWAFLRSVRQRSP